jgi:hypothetical protein
MTLKNNLSVKIALLITSFIAIVRVFLSFNMTFINPDKSSLRLYSDTTNLVTNSPFRVFYESELPLITFEYRINNLIGVAFDSGMQFSDPGTYEFTIINLRGTKITLEKVLDQESPRIANLRENRTYRVGEVIRFTDDASTIKRVEWSHNRSDYQLSDRDTFKFNLSGEYVFKVFDQVDNLAIFNVFVEENSLIINAQDGVNIILIALLLISLTTLGLYYAFSKKIKADRAKHL